MAQRLRWRAGVALPGSFCRPTRAASRPAPLCVAALGVAGDGLELHIFLCVLGDQFFGLEFALDQSYFSHAWPQFLNGKRNPDRSPLASSSVRAVVVMLTLRPRSASTLSYSISGKMICSLTPTL